MYIHIITYIFSCLYKEKEIGVYAEKQRQTKPLNECMQQHNKRAMYINAYVYIYI